MSFVVAALVSLVLEKVMKRKIFSAPKRTAFLFGIGLLIYFVGGSIYFNIYIHRTEEADIFLESHDGVEITRTADGYFFDGPGTETAMVFFPGARIDEGAYSRLMFELALNDVDCFLLKVPLHLSLFGKEKPNKIMQEYEYDHWFVGGHSLGGAVAASFGAAHPKAVEGVVGIGSYPPDPMSAPVRLIMIYGSRDMVMDRNMFIRNQSNCPPQSREYVIEGGNHSGFAYYGDQRGDGEASITPEEQQDETVGQILEFIHEDD